MFDFDLSSIGSRFGNLWDSGTSALSNMYTSGSAALSNIWDSGASAFSNLYTTGYSALSNGTADLWAYGSHSLPGTGTIFDTSWINSPISATPSQNFMDFFNPFGFSMPFQNFDFSSMFSGASNFARNTFQQATGDLSDMINKAAQAVGIDPKLVGCVADQESGRNQYAISSCGAVGVMQIMPETGEGLGFNIHDTYQNILAGATYLKQQLDRFGGDTEKALAAYNAGPGAVEKYGGVPPYKETQNYVAKIMSNYNGT